VIRIQVKVEQESARNFSQLHQLPIFHDPMDGFGFVADAIRHDLGILRNSRRAPASEGGRYNGEKRGARGAAWLQGLKPKSVERLAWELKLPSPKGKKRKTFPQALKRSCAMGLCRS